MTFIPNFWLTDIKLQISMQWHKHLSHWNPYVLYKQIYWSGLFK